VVGLMLDHPSFRAVYCLLCIAFCWWVHCDTCKSKQALLQKDFADISGWVYFQYVGIQVLCALCIGAGAYNLVLIAGKVLPQ
jgi:hypothetical protein